MGQFEGRSAIVTGAASGIGRASARAFAAHGAFVIVCDLDLAGAEETCQLIAQDGGQARAWQIDVCDESAVQALIDDVSKEVGAIDFAHNNAGTPGISGLIDEYDLAEWERVLSVNLTSVFLCMKYQLRCMAQRGAGAIVNTASAAGVTAAPLMPAYVAGKHGVVGLTRSAAIDYAHRGIRVNAICPGPTQTPMIERQSDGQGGLERMLAASVPLARLAAPSEIADAAVWLCSEQSSYVTGSALIIDGGMTAIGGSPSSNAA